MRNSIIYTAVLATVITMATISTGFAEESTSPSMAQRHSDMMKGGSMTMMEGNKMPMMDMMQEMNSMMKNCNEMMGNMNKHMSKEAAQGDSKTQ